MNSVNGKIYVGQTVQPLNKRWALHKHQSLKRNRPLYRAMRKYGLSNFSIDIIEELPDSTNQELLNQKECEWIVKLNSMVPQGYNLTSGGDGKYYLSAETKARISTSKQGHQVSEETRKKISETLTGRPGVRRGAIHTDEAKAKISQAGMGRTASDATKQRMKEAHKGAKAYNAKRVQCVETGIVYGSTGEAARELKLQQTSISSVCLGKRKSTGGLTFRFV